MTTDDIIEYIQNITWEDVKDLPHVNGRVYLNEDLETQDRELENSNFLFFESLCAVRAISPILPNGENNNDFKY